MLKRLCVLALVLAGLAGCGGHGGSGGSTASTSPPAPPAPPPPALTNFVTVAVDAGPAALNTGSDGYIAYNTPYVSVTVCAPGTTNCQTIDHVAVDTGSVGLRIEQSAINASLLSALPAETDTSANPVGECYQYVEGYAFGSVRQGDFSIGGESVADMPLAVVGDSGAFSTTPSSCSSSGGSDLNTVKMLGANGIIGIGTTATDCGTSCTTAGGSAAAIYYDCPATGCGAIVARDASASAPFQQLPNPVAAMKADNNGTILSLPTPAASGQATLTGTLFFGIGTQTNNALGSATVLRATTSDDPNGGGLITAIYNGQTLNESFIDSGSDNYVFQDSAISLCTDKNYTGFYCPSSPLTLQATLQGTSGTGVGVSLTLNNAATLLDTSSAALPGIGVNPTAANIMNAYPDSFDFGLPFFFGRNVYTAIEGRTAGGAAGPYFAF